MPLHNLPNTRNENMIGELAWLMIGHESYVRLDHRLLESGQWTRRPGAVHRPQRRSYQVIPAPVRTTTSLSGNIGPGPHTSR